MKIAGVAVVGPKDEFVVFPNRLADGKDLVFRARAILDYSDFDALEPHPVPPMIRKSSSGPAVLDVESPDYKKAIDLYAVKKYDWMIIQSLRATEGLEWDTINYSDSSTWANWRNELRTIGFTGTEINRILEIINTANGFNQQKIDEATENFLATTQLA